jgi:tetratricopeptide (TPR) repeat protein
MKKNQFDISVWFTVVLLSGASFGANSADHDIDGQKVFQSVSKSIVVVKTFSKNSKLMKFGSGIVSSKGVITTNCHVILGGSSIRVSIQGADSDAYLHSGDIKKDLCSLKSDIQAPPITSIRSATSLKIGEAVYAIGAPKGMELSFSNGIVSQLRGGGDPLIQTTAAISEGSSGGGLFDSKSNLIGVTSFKIVGGESINFAAPATWILNLPKITFEELNASFTQEKVTHSIALIKEKQFKAAVSFCENWRNEDPELFQPYFCLGMAHQRNGQVAESISAFKKVVSLHPQHSQAWLMLAVDFSMQEKFSEAIIAGNESLKIDPNDSNAWAIIGRWYSLVGNHEQGVFYLQKALSIKESAQDYRYLAFLYMAIDIQNRLKNQDHKPDYYLQLGAYKKALSIEPNNPENYLEILRLLDLLGLCEESLVIFKKLTNIDKFSSLQYLEKSKTQHKTNCLLAD